MQIFATVNFATDSNVHRKTTQRRSFALRITDEMDAYFNQEKTEMHYMYGLHTAMQGKRKNYTKSIFQPDASLMRGHFNDCTNNCEEGVSLQTGCRIPDVPVD